MPTVTDPRAGSPSGLALAPSRCPWQDVICHKGAHSEAYPPCQGHPGHLLIAPQPCPPSHPGGGQRRPRGRVASPLRLQLCLLVQQHRVPLQPLPAGLPAGVPEELRASTPLLLEKHFPVLPRTPGGVRCTPGIPCPVATVPAPRAASYPVSRETRQDLLPCHNLPRDLVDARAAPKERLRGPPHETDVSEGQRPLPTPVHPSLSWGGGGACQKCILVRRGVAALMGVWGLSPQCVGPQPGRDPKLAVATLVQCLSLDLKDARFPPGPIVVLSCSAMWPVAGSLLQNLGAPRATPHVHLLRKPPPGHREVGGSPRAHCSPAPALP